MTHRTVQVLTPIGFNQLFEENLSQFNLPITRAYEMTEEIHEKKFGTRRYSSFKSFSNSRKSLVRK